MAFKGTNLRLFLDGTPAFLTKNTTLHIAAKVDDETTKDSPAGWKSISINGFSWDASIEFLAGQESSTTHSKLYSALLSNTDSGQRMAVKYASTKQTGSDSAGYNRTLDKEILNGTAIVKSLSMNSANRESVRLTANFAGVGPLTIAQQPAASSLDE